MTEIKGQRFRSGSSGPQRTDRRERRRQQLARWRAENRERLRQYGQQWKVTHPDRVTAHRQNEYAQRRRRRRRLRLRRKAQRSQRALQRLRVTDPGAWAALTGRNNEPIEFSAPDNGYEVDYDQRQE